LLVSSIFGAVHLANTKDFISIVDPPLASESRDRRWLSPVGKYVKLQAISAIAGGVVYGAIKNFSGLGICGAIGAHIFNNTLAYFAF